MELALFFPVGAGVGIINPHVKFMIEAWAGAIIIGVGFIKKIKYARAGKNLQELRTSLLILSKLGIDKHYF